MRARPTGVDHALGDSLPVEVGHLVVKMDVFQQRGAARTGGKGILVVRDLHALIRRHAHLFAVGTEGVHLVGLVGNVFRRLLGAGGHGLGAGRGGFGRRLDHFGRGRVLIMRLGGFAVGKKRLLRRRFPFMRFVHDSLQ